MPHPSPYDMIQKAAKRANASDRWAVLKTNATERYPVPPASAQPAQEEPIQPARQTQAAPQAQQQQPQAPLQPPFPPPQQRHTALDEIAQRHIQAVRTASAPQPWQLQPAGDRPASVPKQQEAKKEAPGTEP